MEPPIWQNEAKHKCSKSLTQFELLNTPLRASKPCNARGTGSKKKAPNRRIKKKTAQHETTFQRISEDGRALSCEVQSSSAKRGGTGACGEVMVASRMRTCEQLQPLTSSPGPRRGSSAYTIPMQRCENAGFGTRRLTLPHANAMKKEKNSCVCV